MITKDDLDELQQSMECPVCREILCDPTNTPCAHIFCKVCIERTYKVNAECPVCKLRFTRRSLQKNHSVHTMVEAFKKLLSKFGPVPIALPATVALVLEANSASDKSQNVDSQLSAGGSRIRRRGTRRGGQSSMQEQASEGFPCTTSTSPIEKTNTTIPTTASTEVEVSAQMLAIQKELEDLEQSLALKRMNIDDIDAVLIELEQRGLHAVIEAKHPVLEHVLSADMLQPPAKKRRTLLEIIPPPAHETHSENQHSGATPTSAVYQSEVPERIHHPFEEKKLRSRSDSVSSAGAASSGVDEEMPSAEESETSTKKQKFVLLGTVLENNQKKKLKQVAKKLGASVVDNVTAKVTHLITKVENGIAKRTLKYSSAILCGAWVVGFEWIEACAQKNGWVDEQPYEAKGDATAYNAPSLGREAKRKKLSKLFDGLNVHFYGTFAHPNPSMTEVEALAKCGGAKILKNEPTKQELTAKSRSKTKPTLENTVIVMDKDRTERELRRLENESGLKAVYFNWLLDCVSHFKILEKDGYYYRKETK